MAPGTCRCGEFVMGWRRTRTLSRPSGRCVQSRLQTNARSRKIASPRWARSTAWSINRNRGRRGACIVGCDLENEDDPAGRPVRLTQIYLAVRTGRFRSERVCASPRSALGLRHLKSLPRRLTPAGFSYRLHRRRLALNGALSPPTIPGRKPNRICVGELVACSAYVLWVICEAVEVEILRVWKADYLVINREECCNSVTSFPD